MAMELVQMSELSEINRKLDTVIESLSSLKTGQALADQSITGLQVSHQHLERRIEEVTREIRILEQQNLRVDMLKRDIDLVGDAVRNLEQELKPTVEAAIDSALAPYRRKQDEQGFLWQTVATVGKGWWAAALIFLASVVTHWWDKQ
jgi:predicted nuclease with TOPRIM domain